MCVYHRASFICRTVVCQSKRFDWQVGVQTPPLDSTSILSYVNEENRLCVHFSIKQIVLIVFFFMCVESAKGGRQFGKEKQRKTQIFNKGKQEFTDYVPLSDCVYDEALTHTCGYQFVQTVLRVDLNVCACAVCVCLHARTCLPFFFIFLLYFWQSTVIRITTCIKEIHENKILY